MPISQTNEISGETAKLEKKEKLNDDTEKSESKNPDFEIAEDWMYTASTKWARRAK